MNADRPSSTATLIARSLAFTRGDPILGSLVPAESAALAWAALAAQSRWGESIHRCLCARGLRWILRVVESAILPGIGLHYALRKRWLREQAEAAVAAGAPQVVVIAAGFDALALHLARGHRGLRCIEVDHPATQRVKRAALERLHGSVEGLELIPADLTRHSLREVLRATGWDAARPTFFVAEGVTMYLREDGVRALLEFPARWAAPGSSLAWTFMEPDADARIGFRRSRRGWIDAWLRARGEPFTWGIGRERVAEFTGSEGLEVLELAGDQELRARYLADATPSTPLAGGEILCLTRKP